MLDRHEHYNKKGLYSGYDKGHKERHSEDYYSTPTEEVTNILEYLDIDFTDQAILEPCCGGLHMVRGILDYCNVRDQDPLIFATDIKDRTDSGIDIDGLIRVFIETGEKYDVLSDDYHPDGVDWVIMNPPYSIIEPFTMKMLGLANKGIIMLGRLQFLEGEKRYNNILKDFPPSDVYVYVDRIACFKDGDTSQKMSSAQAYAWFVWRLDETFSDGTKIHWIRRADKKC